MAYSVSSKFEKIKEKEGSTITTSYTDLGSPLENKARLVGIYSTVDEEIYISFDGTNNHIRLKETSDERTYDLAANKIRPDGFFMKKGTQIQVRIVGTTIPTSGSVWIELVYGEE